MKAGQKLKIQKLVDDIQSGNFIARDIDTLLISLRDYSRDYQTFRDMADFVAHTDARFKGPSFNAVERLLAFTQLNTEHVIAKKPLDISKPFPSRFIKFFKYQISTLNNGTCKSRLGVAKGLALSRINEEFSVNKSLTQLNGPQLSDSTSRAIQIFSMEPHNPFTPSQADLMRDTLAICKRASLALDKTKFLSQSDKIATCVLAIIHQSQFKGPDGYTCLAQISFPTTLIEGVRTNPGVSLNGSIDLHEPQGDKEIRIQFSSPIFTTSLEAETWAPNILPQQGANGLYRAFADGVSVDDDFRLIPVP